MYIMYNQGEPIMFKINHQSQTSAVTPKWKWTFHSSMTLYSIWLYIRSTKPTNRLSGCPAWPCQHVSPPVRSVRICQSACALPCGWTWCCRSLSCECWCSGQYSHPPSTRWPLALVFPSNRNTFLSFVDWGGISLLEKCDTLAYHERHNEVDNFSNFFNVRLLQVSRYANLGGLCGYTKKEHFFIVFVVG